MIIYVYIITQYSNILYVYIQQNTILNLLHFHNNVRYVAVYLVRYRLNLLALNQDSKNDMYYV